ncbi:hypothetical protein P3S67_017756 [Capsicum chacoense]
MKKRCRRTKEPTPEPEAQSMPDQVAEITKSEPEVQPEAGNFETLDKESKIEPAEEKSEQQAATVDIVETSIVAVEEKKEQVDLEASEQQKAKEAEVPKADPKEEASQPTPIVEEKLTEATEKNEQEAAEAVARNEPAIPVDKVEEAPKEEPVVAESSNQVASTTLQSLMQKMDEGSCWRQYCH